MFYMFYMFFLIPLIVTETWLEAGFDSRQALILCSAFHLLGEV